MLGPLAGLPELPPLPQGPVLAAVAGAADPPRGAGAGLAGAVATARADASPIKTLGTHE